MAKSKVGKVKSKKLKIKGQVHGIDEKVGSKGKAKLSKDF
jgi:hypothetical protein